MSRQISEEIKAHEAYMLYRARSRSAVSELCEVELHGVSEYEVHHPGTIPSNLLRDFYAQIKSRHVSSCFPLFHVPSQYGVWPPEGSPATLFKVD